MVLAAVAGFPDIENFVARALFPDALHILLPAAQIQEKPEGIKQASSFREAVKEAGRQIVTKGSVDEAVRKKLVVDYPPEVKNTMREEANKHFEALLRG